MKIPRAFLLTMVLIITVGAQESYSMVEKEIRTKNEAFKGTIDIEIEKYDDARVSNVYL